MCVTSNTAGAHAVDGLCESATALYATALREGRVARSDLVAAPCLVRRALVHPDPNDDRWMLPLPAPAALTRLLIPFAREVSDHLSDAAALLDTLLPFASLAPPPSDPTITVIHGNDRIMDSLREASRAARSEVLTAQPGGNRMVTNLRAGLENAQAVIEAGGRLRHLYQHPVRYSRRFAAYLDHLGPEHLEVRTMEQAIDRLIVFDRETAYLPARPRHRRPAQHRPPPRRRPRRRRHRPQDGHQRPHLPLPHRPTHADPRRHQPHPPRRPPHRLGHRRGRARRALIP